MGLFRRVVVRQTAAPPKTKDQPATCEIDKGSGARDLNWLHFRGGAWARGCARERTGAGGLHLPPLIALGGTATKNKARFLPKYADNVVVVVGGGLSLHAYIQEVDAKHSRARRAAAAKKKYIYIYISSEMEMASTSTTDSTKVVYLQTPEPALHPTPAMRYTRQSGGLGSGAKTYSPRGSPALLAKPLPRSARAWMDPRWFPHMPRRMHAPVAGRSPSCILVKAMPSHSGRAALEDRAVRGASHSGGYTRVA
jgi:hypothetical protein